MDKPTQTTQTFWKEHSAAIRVAGLLLAVLLLATLSYVGLRPAQAQVPTPDPNVSRSLSVSGTGSVDVAPDRAMLVLGVANEDEMASEAMAQTNEAMQNVIDALVEAGVARADIQTQSIQLEPVYQDTQQPPGQRPQARELVAFRASNIVELTLTSLGNVGEVLDTAVDAGANRIQNIQLMVSDPGEVLQAARQEAWNDAEAKAEQLADLAGATLGPVVTISEFTQGPRPLGRGVAFDEAVGGATPVEPGQQTVSIELQVTWTLQ